MSANTHYITRCRGCDAVVAQCRCYSPNREKRYVDSCSQCNKKEAQEAHKLQGHLGHQGIRVAVENRKGSVRSGVDGDGKPWRTKMVHPYGYLVGTEGADGEEVDAYVGPHKDAPHAFVVHQHKSDGTGYDEDKVMLGFKSEQHARKGYLKHYNSPKFLGPISKVTIERLKALIASKKKLTKISGVMQSSFFEELGNIVGSAP